jgi:hypothetical protein
LTIKAKNKNIIRELVEKGFIKITDKEGRAGETRMFTELCNVYIESMEQNVE